VLKAQGNLDEALENYKADLLIASRLAKAGPDNAGWQRDLSISYEKVGDVLRAQGNLDEALENYKADLYIANRLAKADPTNADWQRGLAISYSRVASVLAQQGEPQKALGNYRQARDITARVKERSPHNPTPVYDLARYDEAIAKLEKAIVIPSLAAAPSAQTA